MRFFTTQQRLPRQGLNPSTTTTSPHTTQRRFNMRDDKSSKKSRRSEHKDPVPVVRGVNPADSQTNHEMKMLATLFPDKKITPYDPKIVAIREQIRKDGSTVNKDGHLVLKDGTVIDPLEVLKFGGSWFVGRFC